MDDCVPCVKLFTEAPAPTISREPHLPLHGGSVVTGQRAHSWFTRCSFKAGLTLKTPSREHKEAKPSKGISNFGRGSSSTQSPCSGCKRRRWRRGSKSRGSRLQVAWGATGHQFGPHHGVRTRAHLQCAHAHVRSRPPCARPFWAADGHCSSERNGPATVPVLSAWSRGRTGGLRLGSPPSTLSPSLSSCLTCPR